MPAKPVFDASTLPTEAEDLLMAARVEPTPQALSEILRVVFGFREFRDGQLQAIQHTLAGHSCLAILPTGQGKSLCYQVRLCCVCIHHRATHRMPSRSCRLSCCPA